jgi:alpha-galactosidase/6-phospho-beta-glucosidase family protein
MFAEGEVARVVRGGMSGSQADATRARDLLAKSISLDQVDWRLQVRVDEREDCAGADFVLLDGLAFAMSHDIQRALEQYSLVRQDQCFLMVGPGDVAKSLTSVKTLSLGRPDS